MKWHSRGSGVLLASVLVGAVLVPGPAGSQAEPAAPGPAATSGAPSWSTEFDIQGVDGVGRTLLPRPDGLWIGGEFRIGGDRLAGNAVLWTGSEWAELGDFDDRVSVFAVHGGRVVAGGRFTSVDGTAASRVAVFDESKGWQPLGEGFEDRDAPNRCEVHTLLSSGGLLYAGGEFTHAEGEEATAFAVWDGTRWSPVPGGPLTGGIVSVRALTEFRDAIAVGGEFERAGDVSTPSLASWRNGVWEGIGGGLGGVVQALHVRGDTLLAGGFFRILDREVPLENFAVWDGGSWDSWGSAFTGIDPTVLAIDEFRGDLIVAGEFQYINGARFEQIARWDGNQWHRMSGGFVGTGGVHVLANWSNALLAGGAFSNASGHSGWGLARWGGSAWNPVGVGHGMSGPVYALAFDGEQILAGGFFARAGRVRGDNVSLWNGSGWVALGADLDREALAVAPYEGGYFVAGLFNGFVNGPTRHVVVFSDGIWSTPRGGVAAAARAVTLFDGDVVVGGSFVRAGGRPAERIASWDGELFNPLGAGLSDTPYALHVHEDELIAGGRFLRAGNLETPHLARWDGQNWFPFPSGPDGDVLAIASLGTDLVVAGEFLRVDDLPANRIALWDGERWSVLGSGFDGPVHALTVLGPRLVAGGSFGHADGKPAAGIAFWDGWSWNPVDDGVDGGDGNVHALLSRGDQLVVGGSFELAGGSVSFNFAVRSGPLPLHVWPGDCNNDGVVDGFDVLALGRQWERSGPGRQSVGTSWAPAPAEDWDPVAATYADADGSGTVDLEDLLAILGNWGRDRRDGSSPAAPALPEGLSWLQAFPEETLLALYSRLSEGDPVSQDLRDRIERALGWEGEGSSARGFQARILGTPSIGWPELSLTLPVPSEVRLELLDVSGRRIAGVRRAFDEGDHRIEIPHPVGKAGSGVYFLRLRSGGTYRILRLVKLAD